MRYWLAWKVIHEGDVLGDPRRQGDAAGTVCPANGKRVVCHVASPGKPGPADIRGRHNLEDCVENLILGDRVRNGHAEDNTTVTGVRGEGQASLRILEGSRVRIKLPPG